MTERTCLQTIMNRVLTGYASGHRLSAHQWQVCHHVQTCRTPVLGGMQLRCDHCADSPIVYHACRDRHCPRCQRQASEDWCERQMTHVLPVIYHHLVFAPPHDLNAWVAAYPRQLYGLLFESVWATLSTFGTDPKRLDGQMGMTAILHTWGQTLIRHVHLHCLVPGGAISKQGHWHGATSTYLFPVRALSGHFRGHFVSGLRKLIDQGECPHLEGKKQTDRLLDTLMSQDWVVYSKPCLNHTETVVEYLARYSHRIALTDRRLHPGDDPKEVLLDYKDYRDADRKKVLHLSAEELIRRYLLHVLPKGFVRIRQYGFLANRCRAKRLPRIREAIEALEDTGQTRQQSKHPAHKAGTRHGHGTSKKGESSSAEGYPCHKCRQGRLRIIAHLVPQRDEGG